MKEIPHVSIIEPTGEPPIIGSIHSIPLSAIHPMPNNPFQVRDDPAMTELIESISQFGMPLMEFPVAPMAPTSVWDTPLFTNYTSIFRQLKY